MAKRKSKDPRKPSKAYLESIGETRQQAAVTDVVAADAGSSSKVAATETPVQGKGKQPGSGKKSKKNEVLMRAIQELGGDDEDYELLEGIDSDDEEPQPQQSKSAGGKQQSDIVDVRRLQTTAMLSLY